MFKRIFGGSDAEQLQFLGTRSMITILALVVSLAASVVTPQALSLIALVMMFVWGWGVVKSLFGITTIAAVFSGNVVVGMILFVLYMIAAYFAGIVFAFLGVGRWIYLKVKWMSHG